MPEATVVVDVCFVPGLGRKHRKLASAGTQLKHIVTMHSAYRRELDYSNDSADVEPDLGPSEPRRSGPSTETLDYSYVDAGDASSSRAPSIAGSPAATRTSMRRSGSDRRLDDSDDESEGRLSKLNARLKDDQHHQTGIFQVRRRSV